MSSVPFFPALPGGVWVPKPRPVKPKVEYLSVAIGAIRKRIKLTGTGGEITVMKPFSVACQGYKLTLKQPEISNPKIIKWSLPKPDFKVTATKVKEWKPTLTIEQNEMATYRVIPHAKVSNNNKRLWKSIEQMYAMYGKFRNRLEREGFKFRYREKDMLWFDVVFRQDEGKRAIEFYLTTTEYQAEKLKRKIENKMDVTLEEVENTDRLQVPKENTIVQEMRYMNHDIFSLNTNTNDTKTPIASIMNTVDELQFDGDFARVSFCMESENRNKWIKNAAWAFEKVSKGKVPQRAGAGKKKALAAGKTFVAGLINEINDLITDTFQTFSNVFFKSDKEFKKEKVINKAYSLEDEIQSTRANASSHEKINLPVMKTRIRVAAHSDDKLTRETLAETLALAYAELSDNNELRAVRVKIGSRREEIIDELNTFRLSSLTKYDADVNIVSTDELAKLVMQMPVDDLQRKYDDALSVEKRVQTEVPAVFRNQKGLHIGVCENKDAETDVFFPVDDPDTFYRGYSFIGGAGGGKDTAIKNWIVDCCLKYGISTVIPEVIVEEGDRGMADGIRDALPPEKVIDIDYGDPNYIVPMDLTEVISKLGRDGKSRFGDEVADFLSLEGLSRSKHILKVAAKASGGSLYNIKRLLEDVEYRMTVIDELQKEGDLRLAGELLKWINDNGEDVLGSKVDPILERLGDFFDNDKLFDVFSQPPKPEMNFSQWMSEGKVIIVRIPARKLGQPAAKTLVHWLTLKVVMTRMLMNKKEQNNGCFIVFNEPEQFVTEGLTSLMGRICTEFRKERMGSIYAFHHWNKLPQSLQENLQGGGVQQFLFYNDHIKTFEASEHRIKPITVEEASAMPKHYAIISARVGDGLQPAFICHMKPPLDKRGDITKYNNEFLTKRHARQFGRHWKELQQVL